MQSVRSVRLVASIEDKRALNKAWLSILSDISYLSYIPQHMEECLRGRAFLQEGKGCCWNSVCMSREVALLCRAALPPSPLRDRLEEAIAEEILGGCETKGGVKFLYGLHKAMWLYLAAHPGKSKEDALTHLDVDRQLIKELGAKYAYCPACMYAGQMNADVGEDNSCIYCPFDNLQRFSKSNCLDGLYENWRWEVAGYNNLKDVEVSQYCARLLGAQAGATAYTIAHLSLRKGVEYIEDFPKDQK